MSGLTDAEREALVDIITDADGPLVEPADLISAVEAIVARAVNEALTKAADEIETEARRHMFAAANKMRAFKERDEHYGAQVASENAVRIIRGAT